MKFGYRPGDMVFSRWWSLFSCGGLPFDGYRSQTTVFIYAYGYRSSKTGVSGIIGSLPR